MASPELCAGLDWRVGLADPAASDAGVLPLDAVHEILLRLPAKELCRLRAVCRSWRSLLSDPLFAADHAARHPEPLIILGYNTIENGSLVKIMDLSGHIVKRVHVDDHRVMSLPLNLASAGRWKMAAADWSTQLLQLCIMSGKTRQTCFSLTAMRACICSGRLPGPGSTRRFGRLRFRTLANTGFCMRSAPSAVVAMQGGDQFRALQTLLDGPKGPVSSLMELCTS